MPYCPLVFTLVLHHVDMSAHTKAVGQNHQEITDIHGSHVVRVQSMLASKQSDGTRLASATQWEPRFPSGQEPCSTEMLTVTKSILFCPNFIPILKPQTNIPVRTKPVSSFNVKIGTTPKASSTSETFKGKYRLHLYLKSLYYNLTATRTKFKRTTTSSPSSSSSLGELCSSGGEGHLDRLSVELLA